MDTTKTFPWREAFPEFTDEALPGISLRAVRQREGFTQVELSKKTGISQRHISEMENGKRPIGKKNARIFSDILKVDTRCFYDTLIGGKSDSSIFPDILLCSRPCRHQEGHVYPTKHYHWPDGFNPVDVSDRQLSSIVDRDRFFSL